MLGPLKSPIRLAGRALNDVTISERLLNYHATNHLFCSNHSPNVGDSKKKFLGPTSVSIVSRQNFHEMPPRAPPEREKQREMPRLFFVQNPWTWFSVKMNFRSLRKTWDPDFDEAEFHRGTRHAVSRITRLIHDNDFSSLEPLMTESGLKRLRQDSDLWEGVVKQNIKLAPPDIQLVIPRKINLLHVLDKKLCDVDVVCVALKFMETPKVADPVPLLYIDLIARFRRDYSAGTDSDWLVSVFRLRKFNTLE